MSRWSPRFKMTEVTRQRPVSWLRRRVLPAAFEIGEKPFRARQLLRWVHRNGESDFECMSDLSKPLRERLREVATCI